MIYDNEGLSQEDRTNIEFLANEQNKTKLEIKYFNNSNNYYERCINSIKEITPESICHYGVKYLDDKLYGIQKNELVVIGSWSGVGKSHMADLIATHNASNGKKVAYFRLEGHKNEFPRLQLWKYMSLAYYSSDRHNTNPIPDFNYQAFCQNKIEPRYIDAYLLTAQEELAKQQENLLLYRRI